MKPDCRDNKNYMRKLRSNKKINPNWQIIEQIEAKARKKVCKEYVKEFDYSRTLPKSLQDRVAKIFSYEYENDEIKLENEHDLSQRQSSAESMAERKELAEEKKKEKYNESTTSLVERLETEFPKFVLKIDTPATKSTKQKHKLNWPAMYICKKRKERVIWPSKIYKFEEENKTLDEQAEKLMDASAERFTEWMNSLGNRRDTDISKDVLKALFNIEGDKNVLSSITTEPKEVNAISKTVADNWNIPEMAIERKYQKHVENRLKSFPKKKKPLVVFGRTVPISERSWIPNSRDMPFKCAFPEQILSGEIIFKNISHLSSTKHLLDFYRNHPQFEKPKYLIRRERFQGETISEDRNEKPLYEQLKLKY